MARTYIPENVRQVHEMAKYMSRYNAVLRPAIAAISPEAAAAYDTAFAAIVALDAFAATLYPLEP